MRADLGWRLDPSIAFLNHGSFGACPDAVLAVAARLARPTGARAGAFLQRELEGHLADARAAVGGFLGADPDGLAFVPNATTGVNAVLRSLPVRARRRAADDRSRIQRDARRRMQAAARRDGCPGRRSPRSPSRSAIPRTSSTRCWRPSRRGRGSPSISHVTSPTGARPADRAHRPAELDAAGHRHARRWRPRAGHGPARPRRARRRRTGRATATSGCAARRARRSSGSARIGASGSTRSIVSHGANDPRRDRPRFRLEFDWTGTADPTAGLALPAAIDWMARLGPAAGRRSWPRTARSRSRHGTVSRTRSASTPPAPDAMIGSMAALPLPGLVDRSTRRPRSIEALFDDDGSRCPSAPGRSVARDATPGASPARAAAPVRPALQRRGDFERLAAVLPETPGARRLRPASPLSPVFWSPAATPLTVSWTSRRSIGRAPGRPRAAREAGAAAGPGAPTASRRTGCAARSTAGGRARRRAGGRVR